MRLSDIQPQYFPRLHYVARMLASDVFVIRDDVQFVRKHRYPDGSRNVSYQAHTPLKSPVGVHLLTVSLQKGNFLPIRETGVSYEQDWARKHVNVLKSFYGRAPRASALLPEIEQLLSQRYATVAELNIASICWALGHLVGATGVEPGQMSLARLNQQLEGARPWRLRRIVCGSEIAGLHAGPAASASERIVALCTLLGADAYMSGRTAVEAYLDTELFPRSGIALDIQSWQCPPYPQQGPRKAGFVANLSILDLLMNVPADEALRLLVGEDSMAIPAPAALSAAG